jgi:hypothetical protein
MKKLALTAVAALFLATGAAHADPANQSNPSDSEGPMCDAPDQDKEGNPYEIPCAQLGVAYDCGQIVEAEAMPDLVWMKPGHIYSDLNSRTITIYLPNMASRKSRRYPVIRYDIETDEITLDGKPCHPVGG